ncbi:hypothetical protein C455_13283 [Haloferax larsenii JCM 13917]|nr:hypothetical protein C455_13283 [Haloferax larsenii JCM 13917]
MLGLLRALTLVMLADFHQKRGLFTRCLEHVEGASRTSVEERTSVEDLERDLNRGCVRSLIQTLRTHVTLVTLFLGTSARGGI